MPGRTWSSISKRWTSLPTSARNEANSTPIAPAPTTAIEPGGSGASPSLRAAERSFKPSLAVLPFNPALTFFLLINGYVFHAGLAIIVFLLLPHILFFEDLIGLSWGHLPNNVIYAVSIVTMISLIAALVMRLSNPAQRIISTFDDYASWFVTFLPVLTGVIATMHLGARYETLLALHILSVALLLIYLPFGKLAHWFLVFVTRSQTGAHLSHRGAQQI